MERFPWLKQKLQLIPENLLHKGFAKSLNDMHKKVSNSATQHFINFPVRDMVYFDKKVDVINELSEIVFIYCNSLSKYGLTVMDGPYISILPYGKSGLHTLTSVSYTHHNKLSDITSHPIDKSKLISNSTKMIKQLRNYLSLIVVLHYQFYVCGS